MYNVGGEYLAWFSLSADPRRQLNCRAEKIVILSHRLSGVEADADADGCVGAVLVVLTEAVAMYREIGMPKHVEMAEALLGEV